MDAGSLLQSSIDDFNGRDWEGLRRRMSNEVRYNGRAISADEFASATQAAAANNKGRIAVEIDTLVQDSSKHNLAARLIVTSGPGEGETARHIFCRFSDGLLTELWVIDEVAALDTLPRGQQVLRAPAWTGRPPAGGGDLAATYRAYVGVINARTIDVDLPRFCNTTVRHNGVALALDKYGRLMGDAQDAFPGLFFDVQVLVTDEEAQMVAARIVFEGALAKPWGGVQPNGRGVTFSEHALYWFDGGKIREVITLVDMVAFHKQMGQ